MRRLSRDSRGASQTLTIVARLRAYFLQIYLYESHNNQSKNCSVYCGSQYKNVLAMFFNWEKVKIHLGGYSTNLGKYLRSISGYTSW